MSICLFLRRDYLAPYTMADKNSSQNCNFNVAVYLRLTSYFNEILLLTKAVYSRFETFTMNDGFLILWISIVLFVRCAVFRRKLDVLRSGSRNWYMTKHWYKAQCTNNVIRIRRIPNASDPIYTFDSVTIYYTRIDNDSVVKYYSVLRVAHACK